MAKVNPIYAKFFEGKPLPARSLIAVKELPIGGRIYLDV